MLVGTHTSLFTQTRQVLTRNLLFHVDMKREIRREINGGTYNLYFICILLQNFHLSPYVWSIPWVPGSFCVVRLSCLFWYQDVTGTIVSDSPLGSQTGSDPTLLHRGYRDRPTIVSSGLSLDLWWVVHHYSEVKVGSDGGMCVSQSRWTEVEVSVEKEDDATSVSSGSSFSPESWDGSPLPWLGWCYSHLSVLRVGGDRHCCGRGPLHYSLYRLILSSKFILRQSTVL